MANCILNLPGYFFTGTFAFQVGIVRYLAYLLLDRALHLVNLACSLVLCA